MLVEFTVENFRSIRSEQLFSLNVQDKSTAHRENMVEQADGLKILKTAAIYGANASGKTNILKALMALKSLTTNSGSLKDGDIIPEYDPYLLGENNADQPTTLGIELYVGNLRYAYKVKYNRFSILYEKFDYYPSTRAANLFTRQSPTDWKNIKFGDHYKGGRKQFGFLANNTYLSKAGNSPEAPKLIRSFFDFISRKILIIEANMLWGFREWRENKEDYTTSSTVIKNIDLGIADFNFEYKKNEEKNQDIKQALFFHHLTESGKTVKFALDKESSGTVQFFKILPLLINSIQHGNLLIVDEIEKNLHPHICDLIIKLFNDSLVNTQNAQLIFTTHDVSLMSPRLLRRDQIYLVEKIIDKGSELYCLDSFDSTLKDSSPFSKWYSEGRLGGIPKINYRAISDAIRGIDNNG